MSVGGMNMSHISYFNVKCILIFPPNHISIFAPFLHVIDITKEFT